MAKAKKSTSRTLNVYANLSNKRKVKKDSETRRRAEYLATLPKHPVKRLLYRLHPKRFWAYWFSKRGVIMALKIFGVTILLLALLVGGLFAYFRKDLNQIRPGEIDKRVQSTVTTYLDRNGQTLWVDKGGGNYKLVVPSQDLSDNLKKATVAIEDRNFYNHSGISITGTLRAAFNNFTGGSVQGGSTLTQQLVKQVFFADQAQNRGLSGIPRKIKELILSIEIERMYTKDQILTLYLNESPYGGPRNGAESGAQAYFGVAAKDLTLAQASLLAAIPQNPSEFNPYNVAGHQALINRQYEVLDAMRQVGYITQAQMDAAKKEPILDTLKPEQSQYAGIKAPHFVQMVRNQLQNELGVTTVGKGGLTVKTTLDLRIQNKLEQAMTDMFNSYVPAYAGFTNGAATVEDTQTGQIVALVGSKNFNAAGFGQDNAATAYIQPGSSIKPLVYSQLFQQKPTGQQNYGSGSILKDEPIDAIYGAQLQNADRKFLGDITIRTSLASSRNVPAVKAMVINENAKKGSTLQTIRDMGASSYCTQGADTTAGLSLAIGGCGLKQIDLVNGYASIARGGVYKPQSSVLEVKNSSGETLKKWSDVAGTQIVSPQTAYVVDDILGDTNASAALGNYAAKNISGVKLAIKTGTSDKGGNAKDLWMLAYSPVLTMGVWLGNPDTTVLKNGTSSLGSPIVASVMEYAHKSVYAPEGKYKLGDWFKQPTGIQRVTQNGVSQVYPSWWNATQGQTNAQLTFDKVSKYKATSCTPEAAKDTVNVTKTTDPVTKKDIYTNVPNGYDATKDDDKHSCNDAMPSIVNVSAVGGTVTVTVNPGTFPLNPSGATITYNGVALGGITYSSNGNLGIYKANYTGTATPGSISATVLDTGYYASSPKTNP
ncbi:MAG: penicillin-binding protein [Candidatus Microsaccharimonas sossegonensis]|uniref:peptidoglycan glycosyltransferase n=1 Tax=Candidatus Microsaccharimonas sossegonensis TaxID=2506948 RepID=A0A4V1J7I8_9BACT|nr:MAG: penicillin-binding protein [Candidatus Microsaccharimonas sossegonensis]